MKSSTQITLIVLASIVLVLVACLPITMLALPLIRSDQAPTPDTFATIQAMVTQTVAAQTQNAPTQTPLPPTAIPTSTPVPATNTPLPTPTAVTYCDWVSFVKDVTVPDGSNFAPGETFTKTWRLKNRGTCTWTPDYMLVYTSGAQMGGTTAVRLPAYVAPGQTVDISVTLTAPDSSGKYVGYWMLRNSSGTLFGYGENANQAFYVDIKVKVTESATWYGHRRNLLPERVQSAHDALLRTGWYGPDHPVFHPGKPHDLQRPAPKWHLLCLCLGAGL